MFGLRSKAIRKVAIMNRDDVPSGTAQNIQTVIRLEEEDEQRKSHSDRIPEWIGSFAGTIGFILLQLLGFAVWIFLNSNIVKAVVPFDPYPFPILSVLLSLEGVLLMSFILIRQSSMSERADRRGHLDLQINLLTEQEVTRVLQMLQAINRHLGLKDVADAETAELSKDTAVENLGKELRANLGQANDP